MINNILKIGTLIVTGRWLKPRWKGLLLLLAFWLLVSLAHDEYIQIVELSGDTNWLWQSSLLKFGLYVSALLLYLFFVERKLLLKPRPTASPSSPASNNIAASASATNTGDGFDFLRTKPRLDSPSEKLLKKKDRK